MEESIYIQDLLPKVQWSEQNSLSQIGKSDIEPPNFRETVEKWYRQLYNLIETMPPAYYVKSIHIFQAEKWDLKSLQYEYCLAEDAPEYVGMVIFKQ